MVRRVRVEHGRATTGCTHVYMYFFCGEVNIVIRHVSVNSVESRNYVEAQVTKMHDYAWESLRSSKVSRFERSVPQFNESDYPMLVGPSCKEIAL